MKTRISLLTWLAVAGFALTACAGLLQSGNTGDVLEWARGEVTGVVDGDTFKVEYITGSEGLPKTIRPYLLDTPETQERTDCFGNQATDQAEDLLTESPERVWLHHQGRTSGDRLLAFVYLDSERTNLFAARMIEDGFGWLDARHPEEVPFVEDLQDIQAAAQTGDGKGLWKDCAAVDQRSLANHVVINEVEANPPGSDSGHEWIELYNPTDTVQDLSGWTIRTGHGQAGDEDRVDIPDTTLGSREHLVVESSTRKIDNEDELLELLNRDGGVVDDVERLTDTGNDLLCNVRIPDGRAIADEDWQLRTCTREAPNGSVRYDRTLDSSEG